MNGAFFFRPQLKVVLQAKKMNVGGSWSLKLIEDKIREKIHERVGGTNLFEVTQRKVKHAHMYVGTSHEKATK